MIRTCCRWQLPTRNCRGLAPLPLLGLVYGIETGHRPELGEDIPQVLLDRRLGQLQARRDLAIAECLRDQVEHFKFASGQRARRRFRLDVPQAFPGHPEGDPAAIAAKMNERP